MHTYTLDEAIQARLGSVAADHWEDGKSTDDIDDLVRASLDEQLPGYGYWDWEDVGQEMVRRGLWTEEDFRAACRDAEAGR